MIFVKDEVTILKEITIESWDDFESFVQHYNQRPTWSNPFVFRGQSRADWPLQPSLVRAIAGPWPAHLEYRAMQIEAQAVLFFRAYARSKIDPHILPEIKDTSRLTWWPIMQHYGAPTRLLDWTRSPYVAAYFAVNDIPSPGHSDGAIWFAHVPLVMDKVANVGDGAAIEHLNRDQPYEIQGVSASIFFGGFDLKTDRMMAQQGLFSVCRRLFVNHDDALSRVLGDGSRMGFGKVIIPFLLKYEFLRRLSLMNITPESLFPGIDGLGRSVAQLIQHEAGYVGEQPISPTGELFAPGAFSPWTE